ncbi:MAG: flagellar export protein FliJ [bacterium]
MASSFVFRFERLLNWIRKREEEEERKLVLLKRRYIEEEERLKMLEEDKKIGEMFLSKSLGDINIIEIARNFIEKKKEDILFQRNKLIELEIEISNQREVLLNWEKKKRMMEKLKERDLDLYNLELKKIENIILDENGKVRYLRKNENY